jgi:hypothetical protein
MANTEFLQFTKISHDVKSRIILVAPGPYHIGPLAPAPILYARYIITSKNNIICNI